MFYVHTHKIKLFQFHAESIRRRGCKKSLLNSSALLCPSRVLWILYCCCWLHWAL